MKDFLTTLSAIKTATVAFLWVNLETIGIVVGALALAGLFVLVVWF